MKEKILLIIPAYNEEHNILKVYNDIQSYNKKNSSNYDLIIINDCSTDNTSKICNEHNIPVIDLVHNLGIGGAVQTGYKYALINDYDIAIQFDGDGQHDINYVDSLVKAIKKSDMVIGSRFIDKNLVTFKSSASRRIGIKVISFFIKMFSGKRICDTTSGFRACNKKLIKTFAQYYPTEYPEPVTIIQCLKNGYKISEVPVEMKERIAGESSIHTWKNIYYMINVVLSIIVYGTKRGAK